MRTPEQQAAFEAVKRLEAGEVLALQIGVLQCAVRALILSSSDPATIRGYFDQLLGQIQSYPGATDTKDKSIVLRDLAETMFRPAASLDT